MQGIKEILEKILLPYSNLKAETQSFSYLVGDNFFSSCEGSEILAGEVKIDIEARKNNAGVNLLMQIKGTVEVSCDRCLENCPIEIDFSDSLSIREGQDEEEDELNIMWISSTDREVDLSLYIYESIALELPYQRVHGQDENGESLCNKEMLAKFKIVSQGEFDEIVSEKQDKENDPQWSKLKDLKEQLK